MANKMKYLVKGGPRPEEFTASPLGEMIRNPNFAADLAAYNASLSPYTYGTGGGAFTEFTPMMYKEADYYGVPDWIKKANPNTDYSVFDNILKEVAGMAATDASGAITPETLIRAAARKAGLPNGEFSLIGEDILNKIDPNWKEKGIEYMGGMDPTKEDWGLADWKTGKVQGSGGLRGILEGLALMSPMFGLGFSGALTGAAGAGANGLASLPSAGTWAQTAVPGLAEAGGAAATAGSLTGGAGYLNTLTNAGLPIDAATGAMTGAGGIAGGASGGGTSFIDELIGKATSGLSNITTPENALKLAGSVASAVGGGGAAGAGGMGSGGEFNWLNALSGLTNAYGNYDASAKMEELYNNLLARGDYFTRTDRAPYRDQLYRSYNDPNYLQNDPGWAGQRNLTIQDVSADMSRRGYNLSGNEIQELGKQLINNQSKYLQGQQQNLANVAGAQFGPEWMGSLTANMAPMIANRFNMTTSPLFAASGGNGGATGNQSGTNGGANWGSFLPAATNAISQFGNWLGSFTGGNKPTANALGSWANDGIDWSKF